jgi:hypothetical protein
MTYNVTSGSTVNFTVEFLDSNGNTTIPSSATLTITYTTVAGSTTFTVISMTQSGSFFVGTWGTGVAAIGAALYSITAPGQVTPTFGDLRLLNE